MAFTLQSLIDAGLILEVPDTPDTNVYQLKSGFDSLVGATTKGVDGQALDVFALLAGTPYDGTIPTSISENLNSRYVVTASIGSAQDTALAGFPTLVELMGSYKKGDLVAIEATPYALPASSGQVPVGEASGEYQGHTVREKSGTATALVILYDSSGAPGAGAPILEEISLAASESTRDHYPRPGRIFTNGIYAVITGSVEGSVFA